MLVFYSEVFVLPLPDGHRFPMAKYRLLKERVEAAGIVPAENLCVPLAATDEQIELAHDRAYLHRAVTGELSEQELRRIGFPWSATLVERARQSVGGTIAACRAALADGVAVNLAGGTHHASRSQGQGFCLFNDSVISARTMQAEGRARRVIIIDCDVHQGNGTAALTAGDASIFTFSIHGARNFPFHKVRSDLDIALDDGAGNNAYLAALEWGLCQVPLSEADLAIYLAGADPFAGDRLGRLALTKEGLAGRDRQVLETCLAAGVPVAVVMSGGYAPQIEDIVDIHFQTVCIAAQSQRKLATSGQGLFPA